MINIASTTLSFLKTVNSDYSQFLLLVVAILSLIFVYREYVLKRRPFVLLEIIFDNVDNKWFFHAGFVNKGTLPGIAKITEAIIKIGNEHYPTIFHNEIVLTPNERQKLAMIV